MPDKILESVKIISSSNNYNLWIYKKIKKYLYGNILDVGSGIGNIAKYLVADKRAGNVILIDKSEEMFIRLKDTFGYFKNCEVKKLDICEISDHQLRSLGPIDTVTCLNTLEHLDDITALNNIYNILSKNGLLIIVVPAIPYIYGRLDRSVGHNRRYEKTGLKQTLEKSGFMIKEQSYFNFFGVITWFLAGKVLKQAKFHGCICKMLDKIVPFLEIFEKYYIPPIGQSLLTVCCKNNADGS